MTNIEKQEYRTQNTERDERTGFTLVEVLLGLLISSVIAGGLYAGFGAVNRANGRSLAQREVFNRFANLTDEWRSELGCGYVADANEGGFVLQSDESGQVRLAFNSMNVGNENGSEYRKTGRVEYLLVKDEESERYLLIKDMQRWAGSKAISEKQRIKVIEGIEKLEVLAAVSREQTGEIEWERNFASKEKMPRAVKFFIKFEGYRDVFEAGFLFLSEVKCAATN